MPAAVSAHEETQLAQTIDMFEVITQSQPLDYQSLEILKEAYQKLGRGPEALRTSKRIASAYVQLGQLSSAIMEYETVLQAHPDDPDVRAAMAQIEQRATSLSAPVVPEPQFASNGHVPAPSASKGTPRKASTEKIEDGREAMHKIFVEGRHVSAPDFEANWPVPGQDAANPVVDPLILRLAERQLVPVETSLKLICERTRLGFLPLEKYDVDVDIARAFPASLCQRWCLLPFDRMSKSILVATANPFNAQAARDLAKETKSHLLYYMVHPQELVRTIKKICR